MRLYVLLPLLLAVPAQAQLERLGPTRPGLHPASVRDAGPVVANGSFEEGIPDTAWADTSHTFGTPICNVVDCGLVRETGPHDEAGRWWAWFGGSLAGDTASLEQTVEVPPGADTLAFHLAIPSVGQFGFLSVTMDGAELFRVEDPDSARVYERVALDIGPFADGGAHVLRFASVTTPDPQRPDSVLNFFVDAVAIDTLDTTVGAESGPPGARLAVSVYPNPARDQVHLSFRLDHPGEVAVDVVDLLGRRVHAATERRGAGSHALALPVRAWPPGVYLVRLQIPGATADRRLTVVR